MHALADAATDDQILYFYCHAESAGLGDPGGPDASALVLSDARITLADLTLDAPTTTLLRGKPLVFINACESAEMSPAFYDGFVPYFMAKGARGVVGTQCKTPALFAAEWAQRFFERFLDGAALGDAFLALRREFLKSTATRSGCCTPSIATATRGSSRAASSSRRRMARMSASPESPIARSRRLSRARVRRRLHRRQRPALRAPQRGRIPARLSRRGAPLQSDGHLPRRHDGDVLRHAAADLGARHV